MPLAHSSPRAWWAAYLLWISLCAALFFSLRGADDPSRPRGKVSEDAASATALRYLGDRDAARFRGFEVVNAALYKRKESRDSLWVVLCGGPNRPSLRDAIVVEVDAETGTVIGVRAPGTETLSAFPAAVPGSEVR